MAKVNLKKVAEDFDSVLKEVWNIWEEARQESIEDGEPAEEFQETPFDTRGWLIMTSLDEQSRESVREDIGWLIGIAYVTGWKLWKPGPREWSPR